MDRESGVADASGVDDSALAFPLKDIVGLQLLQAQVIGQFLACGLGKSSQNGPIRRIHGTGASAS